MDSAFILNIFPTGNLSLSVVTTVLIGVWVIAFFNLRFGWVLSGLVVPGYLVPLMLVMPWSAAVVVAEGTLTYLIVWAYSERCSIFMGFTRFFGRDRFFALLLVSVLVRIYCSIFIWPTLGEYINTAFGLNFDYTNNLHSFGLIVVALIANQFWKPGLRQGFFVLGVTLLITFLLVRFILMPYTNFSVGSLAYMYENLATSMEAGPKAYIVLLTTAFFASHLNLKYGWEYSGILIPALLALEWYQPFKLFLTFVETFVILLVASTLLRLQFFQRTSIEGARKLIFFFTLGFAYKLVTGHIIINFFPKYLVSDFYGFGYLLSTLLAMKMHEKEIAAKMTRASLQTSFIALTVATFIGFGLGYIPDLTQSDKEVFYLERGGLVEMKEKTLTELIREEQIQAYKTFRNVTVPVPVPQEIGDFSQALLLLEQWIAQGDKEDQNRAITLLNDIGYSLAQVEDRYLVLMEQQPKRGWGFFIINLQAANHLQVQVPAPLSEWGTNYSGVTLLKLFKGKTLAIAGSYKNANNDGSADVLKNSKTFFSTFQRIFGKEQILQVRGLTEKNLNQLYGMPSGKKKQSDANQSLIMITKALPEGVNLTRLQESLGDYAITWEGFPAENYLRKSSQGSFAELFLTRPHRRELLFTPFFAIDQVSTQTSVQSIVGYLQDWILTRKDSLSQKGTEIYSPPSLEELLFWDMELITPLMHFITRQQVSAEWTDEDWDELRVMKNTAAVFSYDIKHYKHRTTGQEYLILAEKEQLRTRKFWGTYIFRLGQYKPFTVEVPRPLSERNIFEYATSLFESLEAQTLLISGGHPLTNSDGSADVLDLNYKNSVFTLVNQTILRESPPETPMMVIQCRAFARKTMVDAPDALIAPSTGINLGSQTSPLLDHIIKVLKNRYYFTVKLVDGGLGEEGYEVGGIPQALYLEQVKNKDFISLWLSPDTRAAFRQQNENRLQENHFAQLAITTEEKELFVYLTEEKRALATPPPGLDLASIQDAIETYIQSQDILALQTVLITWKQLGFIRIIDLNSKQAFLVALSNGQPILVANIRPLQTHRVYRLRPDIKRDVLNAYIDSRALWLITGD